MAPLRPGTSEESIRAWLEKVVVDHWGAFTEFVQGVTPVKNPAAAQDVIQKAMVKIIAGEVTIPDDHERGLKTVYSTLRYVAWNHHRTEEVRKAESLSSIDVDVVILKSVGFADDVAWEMCRRMELRDTLTQAMKCLTDSEREVVRLRYVEELETSEVAQRRGCSPSAVRKLVAKALPKMRVELNGRFGAE